MNCTFCGVQLEEGSRFCTGCGSQLGGGAGQQSMQQYGGQYQQPQYYAANVTQQNAKSKTVAGVLGILLGGWGIHKFYLGYTKEGIIMLACWIVGVLLSAAMIGLILILGISIVGVIEGIIYLMKSESDFKAIYVTGRKPWF